MGKQALLLIGDLTHTKKEWSEFSSFAELKVSISITKVEFFRLLTSTQEFSGSKTRADFLKELESGSYDDVVALYRSNDSTKVRTLSNFSLWG